jgi:phage gpG-like protein
MVELNVKLEGVKKLEDAFQRMAKSIKDMRPVFKDFIKHYQEVIMPASFKSRGGIMNAKWPAYSPRYWAWKRKAAPGKAMLRLTDDLFNATQGGPGWFEKLGKQKMEFGVRGGTIPYALVHQEGGGNNIPQRAYFYREDGKLPNRAYIYLFERTREEIKRAYGE